MKKSFLIAPIALAFAATAAVAADKPADTKPPVRDWSQVDTNKDGLVSPEEMEKYLAANPGPLKK